MSKYRLYIAISLLIIFALAAAAFSSTKCVICDSDITGRYYVSARGQAICADCNARYSACSGCGLVGKSLITVDALPFCRECYLKLEKCDICDKTITGGYNRYPDIGIDVCSDCERFSPRCDNCNRPAKNLARVGRSGLCEQCSSKALRCRSCGTALLRNFTFFEGNEALKYCTECISRYPACADCGAPSGTSAMKLEDSRYLCPDCAGTALFDPAMVTPIKNTVLAYMANNFGMVIRHEITYSLKGKDFLEAKTRETHKDINGLFYRLGDDYNIYVLYGLRKKDLVWVLAHEISHAWQAENTSGKLEPEDLEGFAQWVAFSSLKYFSYDTFAETMTKGNTAYSKGLKKMLDIEKKSGPDAVFEYIKSK